MKSQKKLIVIVSIIVLVGVLLGFVFLSKPNQNTFSMELELDKVEYEVDETIQIAVRLKNSSIGCYFASFLNEKINLSVTKEGSEVALRQLTYQSLFLPLETAVKETEIAFDEPGYYRITAVASFRIKGEEFFLEKECIIVVS